MPDEDAQFERVSMALYGGAIAAIAILIIAGLFYARTAMQLLDTINLALTPIEIPAETDADPTASTNPVDQPTATATSDAPTPFRTQVFLLIAASLPGSALIGWALGGGWLRGATLVLVPHSIAAAFLFLDERALAEGQAATLLLLFVPCLVALLAALMQWASTWSRRALGVLAVVVPMPIAAGLTLGGFWWAVPIAWVFLPPFAALAPLLLQGQQEVIRE